MQLSWKVKAGVLIGAGIALGVAMSSLGEAAKPLGGDAFNGGAEVNRDVVMQIEDGDGRVLSTFAHEGQRFVLGESGQRYAIRVFNHSDRRVEAVVTVDGRDVVSGELGDFTKRGYIVPAHGSVLIDGFRRSLDTVAAFRFSTPERSYSALKGSGSHVGVIGLAVFSEDNSKRPQAIAELPANEFEQKAKRDFDSPADRGAAPEPQAEAAPKSAAAAPAPPPGQAGGGWRGRRPSPTEGRAEEKPGLGTGWGENRVSQVSRQDFERANPDRPDFVSSFRYDNRAGLEARGIRLLGNDDGFAKPPGPQAFPLSQR
ncbi:MAG: hypothetical protein H6718_31375 [Polyangiaceae bacterium]|nr:hypothetical protein [Polyangiaceae bacterium]